MSTEIADTVKPPSTWDLIAGNDQVKPDVTFIVENKKLSAHRHCLSLISPVFKAMFETDSAEAKTGCVVITDFTFEEARNGIGFIYGKNCLSGKSIEMVFAVYKFVDKYSIVNASKQLIPFFERAITKVNFLTFAKFAWMFAQENILKKCISFLASHKEIAVTRGFVKLDQRLIMELLQKASDFVPDVSKKDFVLPVQTPWWDY